EAPLPFKPGKQGVFGLERSNEIGAVRLDQHPRTTTMKQTVLVGEGLEESRLDTAGRGNRAMRSRLIDQLVEHGTNRCRLGGNVKNVGDALGVEVVEVPPED